jgi:uncharacterized protein YkwD
MRTWSLVLFGLVACGSIYSDQPQARQPAPQPEEAAGPPGGGGVPANDPWSREAPVAQGGPSGQPDDPYAAQAPARPEPARPPARPEPARPAKPEPPRTAGLSAEAQSLLDAHNRYRARHCAAPMTWSPKLAQVAQQWASSLRDQGCKFGHSGGSYGENLAAGTSGTLDGQAVTDMWYDEVKQYAFSNGGFSMQTGHFTQVVWRESTQLGCAVSTCRGMDIWVCEYDPPGNVQGMFRQNVLPTGCR